MVTGAIVKNVSLRSKRSNCREVALKIEISFSLDHGSRTFHAEVVKTKSVKSDQAQIGAGEQVLEHISIGSDGNEQLAELISMITTMNAFGQQSTSVSILAEIALASFRAGYSVRDREEERRAIMRR